MESSLIAEFITLTGAKPNDAISCLKSWGWDIKKALIDYNDTKTTDYFKNQNIEKNNNHNSNVLDSMDSKSSLSHYTTPQQQYLDQLIKDKQSLVNAIKENNEIRTPSAGPPIAPKPQFVKSDSIDLVEYKKLARGISRATENVNIVSRVRSEFAMDFHSKQPTSNLYFIDTPDYTFTLPDLSIYSEEFRKFLEKDLIECSTLNSLESSQRLNWWVDLGISRKLWPLATTGDGNCLLHAASLAMWGFHDRRLTLRKALHSILSEGECRDALWRRWRFQQTRMNKEAGLVYSETEWAKEWEDIVGLASPEPRQNRTSSGRRRSVMLEKGAPISCCDSIDGNAVYESLEEIHVLALAYVLRRTIVIISDIVLRDQNGDAMAPIPFGGVYLPYEIPPSECHRVPLLLAYDMAHFSALVTMESQNDLPPALISLVDAENILLPIHFCIDPGKDFEWRHYDGREGIWALTEVEHIALLKEYMDIVYGSPAGSPNDDEIYEDQSDEDNDKKILETQCALAMDDNSLNSTNPQHSKSKAAKQLQSVAKQMGSIGKNMSKKIKKNIGSITKLGKTNQPQTKAPYPANIVPNIGGGYVNGKLRLLCAQLKAKRHEYQEEMIKNYLDCAHDRFIETERIKDIKNSEKQKTPNLEKEVMQCINSGCLQYGTAKTSYMCLECYEQQKKQESTQMSQQEYLNQTPRYGTGNSKFYTQSDQKSHSQIQRLPSVKRLNELDQTLYLSKSTFYNDNMQPTSTSPTRSAIRLLGSNENLLHIDERRKDDLVEMHNNINSSEKTRLNDNGVSRNSLNSATLQTNGLLNSRCVVSLPPPSAPPRSNRSALYNPSLKNQSFGFGIPPGDSDEVDGIEYPALKYAGNNQCRTRGCSFFGSSNTNYYCSKCCQLQQDQLQQSYRKLQTDI